jgi:dienelactone hydrolase
MPFTYDGVTREVYVTPTPRHRAIVVLHELPGLTQETYELAEYLGDEFEVYLPLLFGRPGQRSRMGGTFPGGVQTACVRAEFLALQTRRSSPIAEWLRGLCRHVSAEKDGSRVGVIGMCLTGSVVFSMAWDPSIAAAVAAQPALPLVRRPAELTVSDADLAATRGCLGRDTRMLWLRFESDRLSPGERMDAIAEAWGDLVGAAPDSDAAEPPPPLTTVTYPPPDADGSPHSTLTFDADVSRDPTFERSRNRVRNFMLGALEP